MKLENFLCGLKEIVLVVGGAIVLYQGCRYVGNNVSYIAQEKERTRIMEQYDINVPRFDWTNGEAVAEAGKRFNAQYQDRLNKTANNLMRLDKSL